MPELFIPSLQAFLGFARGSGFARTNRFLVEFFPPKLIEAATGPTPMVTPQSNVIGMLCEEANFPGKTIATRSLRINALSEQRAHYVDYKNKEINFKFLTDTSWQAKKFFNNWMAMAINPMSSGANQPREVGFYKDYIGEINIFSLNPILEFNPDALGKNVEEPLYGVKLREAWPVALDQQNMSSGAENYHRLNVGITFKWWEDILFTDDAPASQRSGGATVGDITALLTSQRRFGAGREQQNPFEKYFSFDPSAYTKEEFNGFGGGGGFAGGGVRSSF